MISNLTPFTLVYQVFNNNGIDVKNLASGTYYLKIQPEGGSNLTSTFFKH